MAVILPWSAVKEVRLFARWKSYKAKLGDGGGVTKQKVYNFVVSENENWKSIEKDRSG